MTADDLARDPDYLQTSHLDVLRATEYRHLDEQRHVYLDYTGAGLYAGSQLRRHAELLGSAVFGNPHSGNPTSAATTELVERTRRKVLEWFHGTGQYTAIFTLTRRGPASWSASRIPSGATADVC